MEGQPEHHLVRLNPYFRPVQTPLGLHPRRLTRHGFLSNRWGLQQHRTPRPTSEFVRKPGEMLQARPSLHSTPQRGLGAEVIPAQEIQSTLDRNFGVIQREFRAVDHSIQRLEKTAGDISNLFAQSIEKILERHTDPVLTEQLLEKIHHAQTSNLQREHRLEIERLQRERELDRKKLKKMERDLEIATMQTQIATRDLVHAQHMMDEQPMLAKVEKQENAEEAITAAFLSLRNSTLDFAASSAIQQGPLPDTTLATDSLFDAQTWNHASPRQRRHRVMAKIFHLLFRRILRPGLRIFGIQVFLRSDEHHSISASEAHLRALEKDLEAKGVDNTKLDTWIATTIDIASPLRDVSHNIEGIAQEVYEALSPVVVRFAFGRNADKVKSQISSICEEAVRLKLAIRQAPGNYKIEVPSRDSKKWGEPGCDQETRALSTVTWLRVIDREVRPDAQVKGEGPLAKQTRGDIACIPFGALTKLEEGADGEKIKTILEKGWVISKADVTVSKLKRKAPMPAVAEEGEEAEEQPQKRATPNHGVSPMSLARLKALVDGDAGE